MSAFDLGLELFNLGPVGAAEGGEGDAVEAAVLVAGDELAFGVDGHGDPGTLFALGDGVEFVSGEAGKGDDFVGNRIGRGTVESVFPWALAIGCDHGGGDPFLGARGPGFPVCAGFDLGGLAVLLFQGKGGDEAGRAPFILGLEGQLIGTRLDEIGDVEGGGGLPIRIGQDLFSVQERGRAVVTGEEELGHGDPAFGNLDGGPEGDLILVSGIF